MNRLALLLVLAAACGGDDGPSTTKRDAAIDSPGQVLVDAAPDGPPMLDGPPGTVPLTVHNVLSWCSVTVDGGAASTTDPIVVNVTPGVITLTATTANAAAFEIGPNMWHLTDGDTGNGEDGMVTGSGSAAVSEAEATVIAMMPKCVWVCCPLLGGGGCNVSNPCP